LVYNLKPAKYIGCKKSRSGFSPRQGGGSVAKRRQRGEETSKEKAGGKLTRISHSRPAVRVRVISALPRLKAEHLRLAVADRGQGRKSGMGKNTQSEEGKRAGSSSRGRKREEMIPGLRAEFLLQGEPERGTRQVT